MLCVSVCITIVTSGRDGGFGADWGLGFFGWVTLAPDWDGGCCGYNDEGGYETGEDEAKAPVR